MVHQLGYVPVEPEENGLEGSLHVEQQVLQIIEHRR